MANVHGKDSYVELDNKADTLTNFTGQITNLDWNPSKKIVDSTAMGATAEENIDGQKDASASLSGFCDSATTALIRALYAALLNEERRHSSPKAGIEAGVRMVVQQLTSAGVSYDQFVFSLSEHTQLPRRAA